VAVAESGRQGIELFRAARSRNESFQVVITDLGMPELDGHEVARAIKAESPATPIIMMTGWGKILSEDGKPAPEIDAVLSKPPSIQGLQGLLARFAPAGAAASSMAE